jgi:quercetin dioxygenase-like cupin family protein
MNDAAKPEARVVAPGQGKVLRAFGDEMTVLLDGAATGGAFAMLHNVTPPGGGPPPHSHQREDEWFYPLEGRVEFLKDGRWQEVPVGSAVYMPRNSVHTFRNVGDGPLRMLIQVTPSGFELFFEACADEFAKPDGPSMERIREIFDEYGLRFEDV